MLLHSPFIDFLELFSLEIDLTLLGYSICDFDRLSFLKVLGGNEIGTRFIHL